MQTRTNHKGRQAQEDTPMTQPTAQDFRTGAAFFPRKGQDLTPYVIHATDPHDGKRYQTHAYPHETILLVAQELRDAGCTDIVIHKLSDLA